ncbi:MAG TPA: hydrogenase maturation protease [Gemmataceae bacterium]
MADIVVIGYGNELRRDDGIGPRVADSLAAANYPNVQVKVCSQLVPELAADLADARLVIFVDARVGDPQTDVDVRRIAAGEMSDWSTHTGDPMALLGLTHALYGRVPESWWVRVPGQEFGFGERLSTLAEWKVGEAINRVTALILGERPA